MAIKRKSRRQRRVFVKPPACFFCEEKKEPYFMEAEILAKFTSDRGKIVSTDSTGLCYKHQRRLSRAVKRARHLSILPFISK